MSAVIKYIVHGLFKLPRGRSKRLVPFENQAGGHTIVCVQTAGLPTIDGVQSENGLHPTIRFAECMNLARTTQRSPRSLRATLPV